jgi:hypothetical protein
MRSSRRHFLAASVWPWTWFRRNPRIAGIEFRELRRGDRRHYIWIHGNERTAFEVLTEHMQRSSGRAWLTLSSERNVAIHGGKIDPNRMWSREGAERSLRSLNPGWSAQQMDRALDALDRDRPGFVQRVLPDRGRVLIALHNNGPGYSVNDEVPISDAVALNDPAHPDEFMLCTARVDFELLGGGPFNVLLQQRAPKDDDGSLSRLCAARGVRYVNIEAALGNAQAQRRMLDWTERVL